MAKMIQIRNVPDAIHRTLKVRAAEEGLTLSDFLLREVREIAERPPLERVLERIRERGPVETSEDSTSAIRRQRDAR